MHSFAHFKLKDSLNQRDIIRDLPVNEIKNFCEQKTDDQDNPTLYQWLLKRNDLISPTLQELLAKMEKMDDLEWLNARLLVQSSDQKNGLQVVVRDQTQTGYALLKKLNTDVFNTAMLQDDGKCLFLLAQHRYCYVNIKIDQLTNKVEYFLEKMDTKNFNEVMATKRKNGVIDWHMVASCQSEECIEVFLRKVDNKLFNKANELFNKAMEDVGHTGDVGWLFVAKFQSIRGINAYLGKADNALLNHAMVKPNQVGWTGWHVVAERPFADCAKAFLKIADPQLLNNAMARSANNGWNGWQLVARYQVEGGTHAFLDKADPRLLNECMSITQEDKSTGWHLMADYQTSISAAAFLKKAESQFFNIQNFNEVMAQPNKAGHSVWSLIFKKHSYETICLFLDKADPFILAKNTENFAKYIANIDANNKLIPSQKNRLKERIEFLHQYTKNIVDITIKQSDLVIKTAAECIKYSNADQLQQWFLILEKAMTAPQLAANKHDQLHVLAARCCFTMFSTNPKIPKKIYYQAIQHLMAITDAVNLNAEDNVFVGQSLLEISRPQVQCAPNNPATADKTIDEDFNITQETAFGLGAALSCHHLLRHGLFHANKYLSQTCDEAKDYKADDGKAMPLVTSREQGKRRNFEYLARALIMPELELKDNKGELANVSIFQLGIIAVAKKALFFNRMAWKEFAEKIQEKLNLTENLSKDDEVLIIHLVKLKTKIELSSNLDFQKNILQQMILFIQGKQSTASCKWFDDMLGILEKIRKKLLSSPHASPSISPDVSPSIANRNLTQTRKNSNSLL